MKKGYYLMKGMQRDLLLIVPKRAILVVLTVLCLGACKEQLIEPPEDLIPQAQMTEILYDLAILNGIRTTSNTLLDKYQIETMPYLYEKYGIDSLRFVKSDQYYASVPAVYQSMYQSIADRLEANIKEIDKEREQKNDSLRARNQRVRDSISQRRNPDAPKTTVP